MLRAWDISSSHMRKLCKHNLSELELQVKGYEVNKPINEMLLVAWLLIQRNSLFSQVGQLFFLQNLTELIIAVFYVRLGERGLIQSGLSWTSQLPTLGKTTS